MCPLAAKIIRLVQRSNMIRLAAALLSFVGHRSTRTVPVRFNSTFLHTCEVLLQEVSTQSPTVCNNSRLPHFYVQRKV